MRTFNYMAIAEMKWDSEILGYIAAIYKVAGKQEQYLKQRPEEFESLWKLQKFKVQRLPMQFKALLLQIHEFAGL